MIKSAFVIIFEKACIFFKSGTLTFKKSFAKLKFYPALLKKIPSFVCLVFKIENKWILKLQNLCSLKIGWFKNELYQAFLINDYLEDFNSKILFLLMV